MKKIFVTFFLLTFVLMFAVDDQVREYWRKTLEYGVTSQRIGVIKAIEQNKSVEDFPLIEKALISDINPEVRGYAAYSLINLKVSREELWINALKNEKDPEVLRKIVYGISELKIKGSGPHLFNELTNRIDNPKNSLLVATIIRAIGEIQYKEAANYINGLLTNILYPLEIRSASAIAIGNFADESFIPVLKNILDNPGEPKEVRMYCAYGIGKSGSLKAFDVLAPYIENEKEDLNIRLWAISGLSFVKGDKVLEKLIDFTKVDNTRIRMEAIKSLANYGKNDRVIEILKYKSEYDPEFAVKKEAKNSLQKLGVELESTNATVSSTNKSI